MQREVLEQLIEVHKSINRIARAAGVSNSTIRYWLKRHDLKSKGKPRGIKQRRKRPPCRNCGAPVRHLHNVYCSMPCQFQFKRKRKIEHIDTIGSRALKNYLLDTRGHRCEVCGITEWMGRPAPLELDHRNGNPLNNQLDNVRLICPNCHAQTATYKGKNMGSGRYSRRERYATGRSY
jgi:MerR HTH family regulatory protein